MKPFRKHHLLEILTIHDSSPLPLDAILRKYFRTHSAIGAEDRRTICEKLYRMIRLRGRIDFHLPHPISWEQRIEASTEIIPNMPPHVQVSFPRFLFEKIKEAYGESKAMDLCHILNEVAPTTGRINPLKITREQFLQDIPGIFPCLYSPLGFTFEKKPNIFGMPSFKAGLFELQDEASQLAALEMDPKRGDHVLDYCAGAAGKTLAFAYKMEGKGRIYLHDIRQHALEEGQHRLARAGIQNASLWDPTSKQKMDWILLDVPCSGTGTLRRNPDLKWRLSPSSIENLKKEQRQIFAAAFPYAKKYIVYATCSLLPEENEEQVQFFLENYPITLVKPLFKTLPLSGGMDGLFAATFECTNHLNRLQ
ncbi:MAG: RsmB/NOP family class I SAM-dependent RNA methyltransferase [Simkaniaceae bacterium]|nr:RsmB/NOP family class I SAM-dependent RNA methyltransferase [Simkaniaceae bacterium]